MHQLIDKFLKFLRIEKNASPHTLQAYTSDLKEFHKFLLASGSPPTGAAQMDVKKSII